MSSPAGGGELPERVPESATEAAGEQLVAPAGDQQVAPAEGPAAGGGWKRLHPVTPVLRSWRVLVVILVLYGQQRGQAAFSGNGEDLPGYVELLVALGVLVAALVVSVALSALAWQRMQYQVDAEAVRLHTGVLFRQQRSARLDRLQAVDVVQPLLARMFGFAELRLEVAGGSGSDVRLAYLREADAQRLRNTLLARSAGLDYEGEEAPEAVDRTVLEVPLPRLLGSLALSSGPIVLVLFLVALAVAAVVADAQLLLLGAGPALLGVAAGVWTSFSRSASWRVAVAGDGVRLRHGLLETRTQTVPPGRVQAVRLSQPLLWRRAGWWRLQVNVAGYGGGAESGGQDPSLLVPVATRAEAEQVLALVLPFLAEHAEVAGAFDRDVDQGLDGSGDEGGWTAAPRRARWLDPVAWRRHGVLVTPPALLVRRGRLHRVLDVVPHERTQSLGLQQGPLQRRLGLATFTAHSTPGPVGPMAPHLDTAVALDLLREQAERARLARESAVPERWMETRAPTPRKNATGGGVAEAMTTIGLIGSGNIGSTVARLAVDAGYDVVLSNSRGPETLSDLVAELGPRARAATAAEAAAAGDLVLVTVPLHAHDQVPAEPLAGKVVMDTNNYYPGRDGQIDALDRAEATTSGLLQAHLPGSRVVKVFNSIFFVALAQLGRPSGAEDRSTLPVFGDDAGAKSEVTAFLDAIGYDALDAGTLDESWRAENGRPAYVMPYATDGDVTAPSPAGAETVRELLARADRSSDPQPAQAAPPS